jgi:anti-sigma B factor antagonist
MEFKVKEQNGVLIIKVELVRATLNEAEEFKKMLMKNIELGRENLIVDLNECQFIDSTFLGALVVALKKVTTSGGDLRLVGFHPSVQSMFELTRMHRVFHTFKTVDEALDSYK